MKTKHRILSVLTILALVASLTAVMVAPAGAITQPTRPTIPAVAGVAQDIIGAPNTAYNDMKFTIHKALADGDVVVMTFPSGTAFGAVPNAPTLAAPIGVPVHTIAAVANVITITIKSPVAAGVEFHVNAPNVTNPKTPGSHTYTVFTSKELTPVASKAYTIRGIKVTGGPAAAPTTAAHGTTMTVVGAGYTAGASLDILLGATVVGSSTVGSDGTFTGTFTLTTAGSITAKDGAGVGVTPGPVYNVVTVDLAPGITVSPTEGLVGRTVTIKGRDFTAEKLIDPATGVTFGGAAQAVTFTAIPGQTYDNGLATDGYISNAGKFQGTFTIPATTAGVKQVKATSTAPESATATFTASPQTVTLSTSSAPVGTTITVTGDGWKAGDTLTIQPQNADAAAVGAAITTKAGTDGAFTATVVIAATVAKINVTGAVGDVTKTFTIPAAAISLSVTSGIAGSTVTVTGTGFTAYGTLTELKIGTAVVTPIPSVIAGPTGAFTASFIVPAIGTGAQTVSATIGADTKTATYTIKAVAVSVTTGLDSIAGKFTKVWAFDAAIQDWKLYDTAPDAISTLESLEKGKGYWIEVTEDATIVYGGNSYILKAGWNLIGWLG